MTSLQSIGLTLAGGSTVLVTSMSLFGLAVRYRSTFIAARASARPPDVIWNPKPTIKSQQERGNPWLGWITWTLQLTYDTMLNGIPGTGTREGGLSGSLLRVNLDGIVLIRFHALGLRVSTLAALLLLLLALPVYLSAQCYTKEDESGAGCGTNEYNLTNYERTTLANVPVVDHANWKESVVTPQDGILWRLYLITGCFWVFAAYLCHQLKQEWVQILAMRRVYYLEYDIWGARRQELKQTLMYEEIAAAKREKQEYILRQQLEQTESPPTNIHPADHSDTTESNNKKQFHFDFKKSRQSGERVITAKEAAAEAAANAIAAGEPHLTNREPWIPHPEQRDTVPNVSLYSILVGGLPSLPDQAADSFDAEATIQFSKRESIDWQLSLTTTFFDHCVPNQPGFSSSVAAVTIIPSAMDLSVAWRKWYAAAAKLRRLRFIREQIALRRHFDIEAANDSGGGGEGTDYGYGKDGTDYGYENSNKGGGDGTDYGYGDTEISKKPSIEVGYGYGDTDDVFVRADASEAEVASYLENLHKKRTPSPNTNWDKKMDSNATPRGIYNTPMKNKEYYKQVLGSALGEEHDTHIYDSLEFGPEQAAVYAREFAQSAAPCCPNGCNEGRVRRAPIDRLMEMERIVAVEVHQANLELREARKQATRADTTSSNLHDAQRGQESNINHAVTQSWVGGASPHSTVGGMAAMSAPSAAAAASAQVGSSNDDGDEDEDGDVAQPLDSVPMASRYDRRRASNQVEDQNVRPSPLERATSTRMQIDSNRLDTVAASADLGLEAKLFKKSETTAQMQSSRNLLGPAKPSSVNGPLKKPATISTRARTDVGPQRPPAISVRTGSDGSATKKKPDIRNAPSLQGLNFPTNITLEAQMMHDFSHGSSGSHGRRPSGSHSRRPDALSERRERPDASEASKSKHEALRQRRAAAMKREEEETKSDDTLHDDTYENDPGKSAFNGESSGQWLQVETLITEARTSDRSGSSSIATPKSVATGKWEKPSLKNWFRCTREKTKNIHQTIKKQSKEAMGQLARESTYAVITFTSRQAAVAARACLADGRAAGRWVTLKEMPIPPLSDAAPGDLCTFRNCCRPVTLSINERQKNCRHYM